MKYGLINNSDKAAIEMAIREVDAEFPSQVISILEIGIYAGETGNGMKEYLLSLDRDCFLTGIDNNADKEPIRFATAYNRLIGQDSGNAAYLIDDFSQHLIFIDGNHSCANVVADFFCYAPKLRHDGFMIFHDTGIHIKPFTHYQKTGSEKDPHKYISVREALFDIGLIQNEFKGWELVADVWDDKDEAGGVIVLKKKLKK